jgi:four helix bundle protein
MVKKIMDHKGFRGLDKKYGLVNQLRRASVSKPSKIAEGATGKTIKILYSI